MSFRRTRRVGGTIARTALVAGTATAVSNKVHAVQQPGQNKAVAQRTNPALRAHTASLADEDIALLGKLMKLHNAGHLTDGEYEMLKTKVLAT